MISFDELKAIRECNAGRRKADRIIKHVKLVNVFTHEIYQCDIVIVGKYIAGFFECEAEEIIDGEGMYAIPNLIDCHMHIESTMVSVDKLNDILLPKGIGTIFADPHEIANVCGVEGIKFMLDTASKCDLDVKINLPSCVPATSFEHNGATLAASDLKPLYNEDKVFTLAEVMDAYQVRDNDDMLHKIYDALLHQPMIDGHAAILDNQGLDLYSALGIRNDHECIDDEGFKERLRRGIYTFIREGSVTKNMKALVPTINEVNYRYACFCTDDTHLDDLLEGKGLDFNLNLAISLGLDPIIAITMCTLNAASCYNLRELGAIAPGYLANFHLVRNLKNIKAEVVFQNGQCVATKGQICNPKATELKVSEAILNTINIKPFNKEDLSLKLKSDLVRIMQVVGGNVLTKCLSEKVCVENGCFKMDSTKDYALLVVMERHHKTGNIGKCIVKGFNIKAGAIATSVAHDSHNVICVGTNLDDMYLAIKHLEKIGGGYVIAKDGKIASDVPLQIAGLLSKNSVDVLNNQLHQIHIDVNDICRGIDFNPFLMLSFISLPVIPEIKLSDIGLIDVVKGKVIPLEIEA